MIEFPYFADPERFSYMTKVIVACEVCGSQEKCFDTAGCYGTGSVEAICPKCLKSGKLIEFDVCTNDVGGSLAGKLKPDFDEESHSNIIAYCTPPLPTWQDMEWPIKNGDFCRFVKIASKPDFLDKNELFAAIPEEYHFGRDADEFWEMLPEGKITNLEDGNYDVSFYLFMAGPDKVVIWDCN
jgi:uncharacterized protein CbrC (UPF0167 family)